MADSEELARSAVERLSEDEALRGDLSDIGFGPLLDWAVAAVTAYSKQAPDSAAMDQYTDKVRGVVQEAVNDAQNNKLDDAAALMNFETSGKQEALDKLKSLKLGEDADENAVQIAAILQAALAASSSATTASAAPEQAADTKGETAVQTGNRQEASTGSNEKRVTSTGNDSGKSEASDKIQPHQKANGSQQSGAKRVWGSIKNIFTR
ncbi:MAG TPA: hypothetical protein VH186_29540 [Chloroflexia bacterium]|nr:hypothetical protein [Chloroflexia bacterium]